MNARIAIASFLVLAGCADGPAPALDKLDVALTAPGSGGVTYALPAGTTLLLASPSFTGDFALDGEGTLMSFIVPAGDYIPALVGSGADVWPLTRTKPDGTTDVVDGTLSMPASVTVTENGTTSLVIRFTVASSETITFARGWVDTSVQVDETAATAYEVEISVLGASVTQSTFHDGAPPELASRLPALGDGSVASLDVKVRTTGPWAWTSSTRACAPAVDVVLSRGGTQGFIDLVEESDGPAVTVCIDTVLDTVALMNVYFHRSGAATTATFSDFGDRQFDFVTLARAVFPTSSPVLAGGTLDLPAIAPSSDASVQALEMVSATEPGGASLSPWYEGAVGNAGTLRFSAL